MDISTYRVKILKGTQEYVLKELLEKYPSIFVKSKTEESITFEYENIPLDNFRNIYSGLHLTNSDEVSINISRRYWRKEFVSAGINPSLAYILCMIANLSEQDIVYDPFCGTSTIPITAIKYFNVKRVIASDISGSAIDASLVNFKRANIPTDRYKLFRGDISKNHLNKRNLDCIITNLPFGIRVGSHEENIIIYRELEKLAERILRMKGRIVVLTQEKALIKEVFKSWDIKKILTVDEGGLLPDIFLIKRF